MTEAQETQAYVRRLLDHAMGTAAYALLFAGAAMAVVMLVVMAATDDFPGTWSIAVAGAWAAAATVRYMRSGVPVVPRSTKAAQPAPGQVARDA